MMSVSFMTTRSSPSILISVPDHFPNSTRSPILTSSGCNLPSSPRVPGPAAMTSLFTGFSLAVSGMMMPPTVFSSCSMRRISTRSCNGRKFTGLLPKNQKVLSWHSPLESASKIDAYAVAFKRCTFGPVAEGGPVRFGTRPVMLCRRASRHLARRLPKRVPARIPDFKETRPPVALEGHSEVVRPHCQPELLRNIISDSVCRDASGMRLHGAQRRLTERHHLSLGTCGSWPSRRDYSRALPVATGLFRLGPRWATASLRLPPLFSKARQNPFGDLQLVEPVLQLGALRVNFRKLIGNPLLFLCDIGHDRHVFSP